MIIFYSSAAWSLGHFYFGAPLRYTLDWSISLFLAKWHFPGILPWTDWLVSLDLHNLLTSVGDLNWIRLSWDLHCFMSGTILLISQQVGTYPQPCTFTACSDLLCQYLLTHSLEAPWKNVICRMLKGEGKFFMWEISVGRIGFDEMFRKLTEM